MKNIVVVEATDTLHNKIENALPHHQVESYNINKVIHYHNMFKSTSA